MQARKNKLFQVAQEVGRVVRTTYLLAEWINNSRLRREVTATTNIIESYNSFAKWLSFGGEGVIAENEPDEQQKRLRYRYDGSGANSQLKKNWLRMDDLK
jgi:TnpA family transposase